MAVKAVTISGPRDDVEDLVTSLTGITPSSVEYRERPGSVLNRSPLGQFDIVVAVVTFVTAVAAPVISKEVQDAIDSWQKQHPRSTATVENRAKAGDDDRAPLGTSRDSSNDGAE